MSDLANRQTDRQTNTGKKHLPPPLSEVMTAKKQLTTSTTMSTATHLFAFYPSTIRISLSFSMNLHDICYTTNYI